MLTSATRLIDRIDEPSQSIERIWTRLARGSLFIPLRYELSCFPSSIFVHRKIGSIGSGSSAVASDRGSRLQRPSMTRGAKANSTQMSSDVFRPAETTIDIALRKV